METDMEQKVLAEDFMIVKESTKRSGQVQHVSRGKLPHVEDALSTDQKNSESSDNRTLAEVMGLDEKTQKRKEVNEKKREDAK